MEDERTFLIAMRGRVVLAQEKVAFLIGQTAIKGPLEEADAMLTDMLESFDERLVELG